MASNVLPPCRVVNQNDRLAKEVEEQIFATFRLQCERHLPVDLPFPQFTKIAQLFDNIEREIRTQYSNGGPDLKLQIYKNDKKPSTCCK